MSKFDSHFKMTEQDAIAYALEKLDFFPKGAALCCKEIGDGNINYVFRVVDSATDRSVIIKHADVQARGSGGAISVERSRIEAELLEREGALAPGLVPKIYHFDPVMCCMAMEDLRAHENMRYALIDHKTFPRFAQDISTFMANTLIKTTDYILSPTEKKALVKRYVNPQMCEITERLVYTEPYTNAKGSNKPFAPNREFLERELYCDAELLLEAAKLKDSFLTKAQSLIHGDLHTGSIFVTQESTMVLDPEFAFYGPAGYDVGNVIANLMFAWANAEVTMEPGGGKEAFQHWVEESITDVLRLFREKALKILQKEAACPLARQPGFAEWYVGDILKDTAGVAGLELNRRIIGSAKVRDIAGIEDAAKRTLAERICVLAAKELIIKRGLLSNEELRFVPVLHGAANTAKGM